MTTPTAEGDTVPGIVGFVHRRSTPVSIEPASAMLKHLSDYETETYELSPNVTLGRVCRSRQRPITDRRVDDRRKMTLLSYGAVFLPHPQPHRATAEELLNLYDRDGLAFLADADGAFTIVVFDELKRRLLVANDRLGVLPIYYARGDDAFCFGPEAKFVLTALQRAPRFSTEGLLAFLSAGYCLGSTTLFDGIEMLLPGSIMSINLDDLSIDLSRYWTMHYDPDPALRSRRTATATLADAVLDGHRAFLSDDPKRFDILLSGGMDSRGMLAACEQLGRLPARALGYGLRDDIPRSDAAVARSLAEAFGIPFDFHSYDTQSITANFMHWSYVSELANDNFGWCAEGVGVLTDWYDSEAEFYLVGDECWGWEGYVYGESDARQAVIPHRIPAAVRAILPSSRLAEYEDTYDRRIASVADASDFERWEDYKDYLYLYSRVVRFIFSLGYYRELATEVRRPFLTRGVLDVIRRLPVEHRVNKNLYLETLRRHFPAAVVIPDKSVNSLPDLQFDVRAKGELRTFFRVMTEPERVEEVLTDSFCADSYRALRDGFFDGTPKAVSRDASTKTAFKEWSAPWKSRSRLYARIGRIKRRNSTPDPFKPLDVLRRCALLVALHQQRDALRRVDRS